MVFNCPASFTIIFYNELNRLLCFYNCYGLLSSLTAVRQVTPCIRSSGVFLLFTTFSLSLGFLAILSTLFLPEPGARVYDEPMFPAHSSWACAQTINSAFCSVTSIHLFFLYRITTLISPHGSLFSCVYDPVHKEEIIHSFLSHQVRSQNFANANGCMCFQCLYIEPLVRTHFSICAFHSLPRCLLAAFPYFHGFPGKALLCDSQT